MDRRNFLKGTFGGVAAGGIVIAAGLPDTQAFVEQVKIGDPVAAAITPIGAEWPNIGEVVFNHLGQPIGVVSRWESYVEKIDVTSAQDTYHSHIAGRRTTKFEVVTTSPAPMLGYGGGANIGAIKGWRSNGR